MKKEDKKEINIVSLFSGCGGLDLGFHLAKNDKYKYNIIWANDFFESACKTFSKNFKVKFYNKLNEEINEPSIYCGDICNFNFKEKLGNKKINIIIGGFPCQDFSVLRGKGNREGIKIKRGQLYLEFVRSLIELQPKIFLAENVKGLVSANQGMAFKRILEDFENLEIYKNDANSKDEKKPIGYHLIHKKVINFTNFGIAQNRERLIIIGVRKDLINEKQKQEYIQKLGNLDNTIFSKYPLSTIEVLYGEALNNLNQYYEQEMKEFNSTINNIKSERQKEFMKKIWNSINMNITKDYLNIYGGQKKELSSALKKHTEILKNMRFNNKIYNKKFEDGTNNLMKEDIKVQERMAHIPPGENHLFVKGTKYHVSGLMSNIYRRLHPLKPSPTIIANGGGGTWGYHYLINRQRLTNRERARIQSFPDWFQFSGTPSEIRTQLGNAVPPFGIKPFAEELFSIFKRL